MASISVGSVSVDVVPSARGFARDLRRQLVPDAAKIGDEIGNTVADGIKRSLGNPLADPLADSVRQQRGKAPGQGDQVAGAFAKGFQRRLKAAFASLPKAEIDADSSAADRKLAGLRTRMQALSEQTIGVDLDADAALAELAAIKAELEDVGRSATVDVRADIGAATAQLAAVQAQVTALDGRQVDVTLSKRSAASFSNGTRSASLMRSELVSLIAVGVAVAPAAIAAGAGFVSFAALAAPSIIKVIKAQGDMAAEWSGLDQRQRVAAISVKSLTGEYKQLATSVEPEVLSTFNAGLGVARAAMIPLVPLTRSVSNELTAFANRTETALKAPAAHDFFAFLTQQAGPAVTQFGSTLFAGAHLAASLTTALTPLAFSTLRLATGVAELAADLFDAAPVLAEMVTLSLALRSPIGGLGTLIAATGGRVRTFTAATKGASLGTKALNLASSAGPTLYLAAGAALLFFAYKAATAKTETDKFAAALRIQYGASGNNLAGYQRLSQELTSRYIVAVRRSTTQTQQTGYAYKAVSREAQDYANQLAITTRQQANITSGSVYLARQFGITSTAANQLATAAGVNLSAGITGTGKTALEAQEKIRQYAAAVEAARNPTIVIGEAWRGASNEALSLKDRTSALTSALDAYFNPSIAVYQANVQLANSFNRTATAIAKAKGGLSGTGAASRAAKEQFGQLVTQTSATAQAIYGFTNRTKGAAAATNASRAAVSKNLPVLLALAGKNTDARNQVLALARSFGVATGKTNISRAAFIKTATSMDLSRDKAEALWREFKKIPGVTNTQSNAHTRQAMANLLALRKRAQSMPKTIDMRVRMDISNALSKLESLRRYSNQGGKPGGPGGHVAEGGIMRFARGGILRMARGGALEAHFASAPTLLYGERETGGEAFIPLASSKRARSEAILSRVAEIFGGTYVKGLATAASGLGPTTAPGAPSTSTASGVDPAAASTQQAVNAQLAVGLQRTTALNTAAEELNATKRLALSADKTALTQLRTLTATTTTATGATRAATTAGNVSATATRAATTADRAKAAQLGRSTAATRTAATATRAAGIATDSTRTKTVSLRGELGRAQGQLTRTGTAATALTGKYRTIPKTVKTAISVNAKGQYTIKDLGSFAAGGPVWLASGGPVYGAGTATSDSIPARLSNGEFVIRAQAHQRYGTEMLDAINEQRLAKGGSVTSGGPVSFTGMPAQVKGGLNKQRDTSNKWTAEYVGKEIKKLLQGPLGVVRAARSQIGQGDSGRDNFNKYAREFAWNGAPWCHSARTLVDTPRGRREIAELEPGDVVVTPSGAEVRISRVLTRTKPLLQLTALSVPDTEVTADHPYWARRRKGRNRDQGFNEAAWIPAGKLRSGDLIALPIPPEGTEEYDPALAYLLGMYLADGHRHNGAMQVTDSADNRERIVLAFKAAGYPNVREWKHNGHLRFSVWDAGLYGLCGDFGDGSEQKGLPGYVHAWTRQARQALLDGYLAGDGYLSKRGDWQCATVSRRLAHDLAKLIRSLDRVPGVTIGHEACTDLIKGREINKRKIYRLKWRDDPSTLAWVEWFSGDGYLWVPVRRVTETGREETVYDLTVPGEHAFIADGAAVHNCAAFVSWCIRAARAQRMYPGYPTAAVAGFNSRMKHVRTGQPGDLGVYRGNGHINIIASGPRGGGYLTIGGNQGPKVNSYVRGGQSSILRPGFAAGGPVDRQVFRERNFDPGDRNDPLVRLYSKLRPSQAAALGDVLNSLNLDTGGYLPPGTSLVDNGTGRPEPVLKPEQLAALVSGEGRSVHIGEHAQITIADTADADTVAQRADFLARSASF